MNSAIRRTTVALTIAVCGATCGGMVAGAEAQAGRSVGAEPPPTPPPPPTVVDNEFIPEDANLSDCVSALPRPECGSDARGGWRQTVIFAVLAAVLALGGWRLVTIVRRRDRAGVEEVERIDAERAARTSNDHDSPSGAP